MNKLTVVYWKDIAALEGQWDSVESCIKKAQKLYEAVYKTVGYIIYENDDFLVIAATHDMEGNEYNDVSMIPKSVITKTRELDEPIN